MAQQLDLGLAGNGPNGTYGDCDDARFADFFEKASAVYVEMGTPPADGLTIEDLYTNEFVDPSIGL